MLQRSIMPKMLTPKCSSILIIERRFHSLTMVDSHDKDIYELQRGYVRSHSLQTEIGACVSYIFLGYNLQTQIKGGFWEGKKERAGYSSSFFAFHSHFLPIFVLGKGGGGLPFCGQMVAFLLTWYQGCHLLTASFFLEK